MPAMRAAGYDYAELRVVDLRPDDDETVYAPIKRQIEDAGLPPEALNVFIPPHHPVVGPDRDLEGLRAYVTTAMGRMRNNIGDKFVWDVAPHPAGAAGKSTAGGGSGQAISAFSEQKDAAWEFLKFMASTAGVEVWTDIMGIVPPLQSVAASDVFLKPGEPPEHISVFTDGAPWLRPDPRHATFAQASSIAVSELDRLWIGQAGAQEVADSLVAQINDLL